MEERIEQLEKTVSILHGEITALKELLAVGFKKVESNIGSIGMSVGIRPTALTDEISKLAKV
jgi:hypothetical protein